MTVPVVGSITRKSTWRYFPEIHASRLSVSGSLRPKLGLLILSGLLLAGVIILVVPLVTQLYRLKSSSSEVHIHSPHPAQFILPHFIQQCQELKRNSVISPAGLSLALAAVHASGTNSGVDDIVTNDLLDHLSSYSQLSAKVVSGAAEGLGGESLSPQGRVIKLNKIFVQNQRRVATEYRREVSRMGFHIENIEIDGDPSGFLVRLQQWLESFILEGKDSERSEGITTREMISSLHLHLPASLILFSLHSLAVSPPQLADGILEDEAFFSGSAGSARVPMVSKEDDFHVYTDEARPACGTAVRLGLRVANLSMVLVLPAADAGLDALSACDMLTLLDNSASGWTQIYAGIKVPLFSVSESLDVETFLVRLGVKEALGSAMRHEVSSSQQKEEMSLTDIIHFNSFTFEQAAKQTQKKVRGEPKTTFDHRTVVFNRPFMFMVYEEKTKFVLSLGYVVKPAESAHNILTTLAKT